MLTVPEIVIIALAASSGLATYRYFGGIPKLLTRIWIICFYLIIWFDIGNLNTETLAKLSRYGLVMIFLADIVPAIIAKIQRRQVRNNDLG